MNVVDLKARDASHGVYRDRARVAQMFKNAVRKALIERGNRGQPSLSSSMVESLDMITHKMSRIIVGDPFNPEHWEDIVGYATLVLSEIEEDQAQIDKQAEEMSKMIEDEDNSK